jgi:uncharacterized peroxidase-related enzyme
MPHISVNDNMPGIIGLLFYKSSTGKALSTLAHTLLKGTSPLSSADRELIAAHVSYLNNCEFCHSSHGAAASCYLNNDEKLVEHVKKDYHNAPVSDKLKALLKIADKVQQSGKNVTVADIEEARKQGANDEEIHDAVLIAAAFCMYNRYVDGLATTLPNSAEEYKPMGKRLATQGYKYPNFIIRMLIKFMAKRKKN